MAQLNYNGKTVSDEEVRNVLESVCSYFESDVTVTSGDRSYVPKGGSPKSMHLLKRAADFHVANYDDATAFLHMKVFASNFFSSGNRYDLIHHGIHTETTGAHLHLGRLGSSTDWGYVKFIREGTTADTKDVYTRVYKLPLIGVSKR